MKYYAINEGKTPVALVFFNPIAGDFHIRSKVESLSIIFEAIRKRNSVKLVKSNGRVTVKLNDMSCSIDSQVESIIDEICEDKWSYGDKGVVGYQKDNDTNYIVSKYLS